MKMFMRIQPVALVLTAVAVAGCEGKNETVFVPPAATEAPSPELPSYEALDSTADATSTLGGVAIRSNNDTGKLEVTEVQGTLQHDTGAATADDGTFALEDPDGPIDGLNETLIFKDGTATIRTGNTGKFEEDYEYVVAYSQNYNSGGAEYDAMGVIGVVTRATDMPDTGTATYEGEAAGLITTADGEVADLKGGTSTVEADFGDATVNVTMAGFTSFKPGTDVKIEESRIDTIKVTGMEIDGNAFTGKTVAVMLDGDDVTDNVIGVDPTSAASGAFFGIDTDGNPDEAAGVVLSEGDAGKVRAEFIAD